MPAVNGKRRASRLEGDRGAATLPIARAVRERGGCVKTIAVIGEIVVEIVATSRGTGFREPLDLVGPYPSGAPAIFADQAARLGQPCAVVGAVGDDDFGRVNLDRLAADGVDIAGIAIDPDRPTGSAFVRYRPDGARDFVFNIRHAACGYLPRTAEAAAVLARADHLHVMGSSLFGADFIAANVETAAAVRARGGTVSFDPNLRMEMLHAPGMRAAMDRILALTDLFLPSGEELLHLTGTGDAATAVAGLLDRGVRAVVHKLGAQGVRYHDAAGERFRPAFRVEEVDPTGAGDCFGAAFTTLWLRGTDIDTALTRAAAAGALAVTRRGPMEGVATMTEIEAFLATAAYRP
jgi:sugar/nucleoside kinase (ribokinase family)